MKHFKNILLFAGMEQNEAVVNRAVTLAIENHARLTFMDVVQPSAPRGLRIVDVAAELDEVALKEVQDRRERQLAIAAEYLGAGAVFDVVVRHGDPATEVVRQVHANGHDLLVTAVNGDSATGGGFGSTSRSLLRICPCPVWLLKPEIHGEFDVVLAAVDMRDPNEAHVGLNREILALASSLSTHERTSLHVVSAWDLSAGASPHHGADHLGTDSGVAAQESTIQQRVKSALSLLPAAKHPPHVHIRRGNPASIIRSVADEIEADLLVMGTVCRTGAGALLIGTTAENVLDLVTCSILALKPEGFVSPVEMATKS